jgi:hypothetical protein
MRRAFAASLFVALAGALSLSFILIPASPTSASAERKATFLIPASDGYGIAHCLLTPAACGDIVANAWCESHGYARAASYGAASREDFTGALSAVSVAARDRDLPMTITCTD